MFFFKMTLPLFSSLPQADTYVKSIDYVVEMVEMVEVVEMVTRKFTILKNYVL